MAGNKKATPRRRGLDRYGPRSTRGSDGFFQLLGGAESDLLAGLDLDRLTRCRVAAHAGGTLADLANAKPDHADALAPLEMAHDHVDEVAEQCFGLLLRHVVTFRHFGGDVLECDRRRFCCCGSHAARPPCCD